MNSGTDDKDISFLNHLYNRYRDAKLNEIYYFTQYKRISLQARVLDFTAAFTSCTMPALLAFHVRYDFLLLISSFLAILCITRPLLSMSDKQRRYSFLFRKYVEIRNDMGHIIDRIKAKHQISEQDRIDFQRVLFNTKSLEVQDDPAPARRLLEQLQRVVNKEIPPDSFWWPSPEKISD